MAKKTFSRVSGHSWVKDVVKVQQVNPGNIDWHKQHWRLRKRHMVLPEPLKLKLRLDQDGYKISEYLYHIQQA